MTPYVLLRIREALAAAKGNRRRAEDMVSAQALDDPRLLKELMGPHLKPVAARAVAYVADGKAEGPAAANAARPDKPETVEIPQDEFGRDLARALAGGRESAFGLPEPRTLGKTGPKVASRQHVETLKSIAAKSKTNLADKTKK